MAKTNKYSSINFNHIYDKNPSSNSKTGTNSSKNPSSSSSSSFSSATYSSISSPNKSHGRMLVLTRPTPKPITSPPLLSPRPPSADHRPVPDQTHPQPQSDSDSISLRPLGRTGTGAIAPSPIPNLEKDKEIPPPPVALHKPEKFVPPHLRAGFVGKEERPVSVGIRSREANQRQYGNYGYGEDGRPKSGGGYERMSGGAGEADLGAMVNRPRSSGNRPTSSG